MSVSKETIWIVFGLWVLGFWPAMATGNSQVVQFWLGAPVIVPLAIIVLLYALGPVFTALIWLEAKLQHR